MKNDPIIITVKSGRGGKGCESFEHKSPVKLIPNGGNGGDGGDVIVRADRNISDLSQFRYNYIFQAGSGTHGSSNKKEGRKGEDLIISVPCGTSILNSDQQLLIRDLVHPDDSVVVLRGGRGGRGNSAHRSSTEGEAGFELQLELDYKLVADIFLIGLPNSGKSSLLGRLTGANVKMTNYPFSTTTPNLGVMETVDFKRLVLCELPSLIENSCEGKGLGAAFLKHLERAKQLIFVLDPASQYAESLKGQIEVLEREIECFNQAFSDIPVLRVVSKIDLPQAEESIKKEKLGKKVMSCSAQTGQGIEELKEFLIKKVLK